MVYLWRETSYFFLKFKYKNLKKKCKNHSCAKLLIPETNILFANKILVLVSSAAFCSGQVYQWIEMQQKTRWSEFAE